MILGSFIFFLLIFFGVGMLSVVKAKHSRHDYYLAGSSVPAWLTGLSAVATQNSGYVFVGFIGFVHVTGLSAVWVMSGWVLGDYFGSLFIHRRLRDVAAQNNETSFIGVLSCWGGKHYKLWPRLAAIVTVTFLGAYAAAQIMAGSKALEGVLGWHPNIGAVVVAIMIMAYSIAGGIRASIWTDAAQAVVMLIALVILLVAGIEHGGGIKQTLSDLKEIPGYLDWYPEDILVPGLSGLALFVVGWFFAGFSVVGQPHIMVRFMAMKDSSQMSCVRSWYYGYFVILFAIALALGIISRLYLGHASDVDPELTLPLMAVDLLPPYLVGLILAGMFAATMSTADSLVLSCSASITHDIFPSRYEKPWQLKFATAMVTIVALSFALVKAQSVFHLVILSWSAIACSFGPLIALRSIGREIDEKIAIAMLLAGLLVSILWRVAELHNAIYEGFPGVVAGLIIGCIFSSPSPSPQANVAMNEVK